MHDAQNPFKNPSQVLLEPFLTGSLLGRDSGASGPFASVVGGLVAQDGAHCEQASKSPHPAPIAGVSGHFIHPVPFSAPGVETGREGAGVVPLGIGAKSSPAPLRVDLQTGEILAEGPVFDPVAIRVERFALQSVARSILPDSRTAKCLRLRRKDKADIEVWRSLEHGTASYGGLQTCGSVWACPVCAAKISERRRAELKGAIDQHRAVGGEVLLLTLTNPHKLGDSLAEVLERQARAMSRMFSMRRAVKLWASIGCIGTVRAWEVTHGRLRPINNGWHPHFHLLLFVPSGLRLGELRVQFHEIWADACRLAGLPIPSDIHGVRVDNGDYAADYASKWGLEQEMTKGHVKKARHGETPFDLLRARLMDGDRQAAALFREFALCFKGRRQLVWSRGLKAHFGIGEATDDELAAVQDDRAELLGRITLDEWRAILRLDLRADVLELARFGWEPVQRLLDSLPSSIPGDSS